MSTINKLSAELSAKENSLNNANIIKIMNTMEDLATDYNEFGYLTPYEITGEKLDALNSIFNSIKEFGEQNTRIDEELYKIVVEINKVNGYDIEHPEEYSDLCIVVDNSTTLIHALEEIQELAEDISNNGIYDNKIRLVYLVKLIEIIEILKQLKYLIAENKDLLYAHITLDPEPENKAISDMFMNIHRFTEKQSDAYNNIMWSYGDLLGLNADVYNVGKEELTGTLLETATVIANVLGWYFL